MKNATLNLNRLADRDSSGKVWYRFGDFIGFPELFVSTNPENYERKIL